MVRERLLRLYLVEGICLCLLLNWRLAVILTITRVQNCNGFLKIVTLCRYHYLPARYSVTLPRCCI
jgi:hypothetical protein